MGKAYGRSTRKWGGPADPDGGNPVPVSSALMGTVTVPTRRTHGRSSTDHLHHHARCAQATPSDVDEAVSAAAAFAPTWAATPWAERLAVLRRAAELIDQRRFLLAATLSFEVGKNRLEALGDAQEAAELIRYYCDEMGRDEGFARPMGRLPPDEHTLDALLPYGVWAVISPFNFPAALAAGPAAGALIAGNTVVLKPSSAGTLATLLVADALSDARLPPGALQVVTGSGAPARGGP